MGPALTLSNSQNTFYTQDRPREKALPLAVDHARRASALVVRPDSRAVVKWAVANVMPPPTFGIDSQARGVDAGRPASFSREPDP